MKNLKNTKKINDLLKKSNYLNYSFADEFNEIIKYKVENYVNENTNTKESLKSFFNDLQHGGCISGMISNFIYHSDCKDFYIKHIEDLEELKTELEDNMGECIKNRHNLPHYTFITWLCFEEYCYNLYNNIFEI